MQHELTASLMRCADDAIFSSAADSDNELWVWVRSTSETPQSSFLVGRENWVDASLRVCHTEVPW